MDEKKLMKHYEKIACKLNEMIPVERDSLTMCAEETGRLSTAFLIITL